MNIDTREFALPFLALTFIAWLWCYSLYRRRGPRWVRILFADGTQGKWWYLGFLLAGVFFVNGLWRLIADSTDLVSELILAVLGGVGLVLLVVQWKRVGRRIDDAANKD